MVAVMSSEVEICNMALSKIRAGSINSLTENSIQAQQCKLWYPYCRKFLLEDSPWGFATKIAALAVLSGEDLFNWSYVYQYPSDCLYLNRLILNYEQHGDPADGIAVRSRHLEEIYSPDLEQQIEYRVYNVEGDNGKVIAANDADLRAEYRFNVTDPNKFSNSFVETLAAYLASKIAIPIVGAEMGRQFKKDALDEYMMLVSAATANDRNQEFQPQVESDFILIRNT